ncbi:disease resistance protein [Corchorus capsularis]|uniref:Disease resistance protein n=1 Tax=Corchorus capsularis TaxID=210143 RepID=A0A1R3GWI3_COCAP|nr:disease resistance protein [Corchorus capsularis]
MNYFSKLKEIEVESCEKLSNIFPMNMMERLENLEKVQIVNCDSLEEIFVPQALTGNQPHGVATTESILEETMAKFVFPSATYLRLKNLPSLKSFYTRAHATEWPSLRKMKVVDCQNVQIFASECPGFGETQKGSQVEISNQPPLFRVNEVTFPILEELILKPNDTWHGQVLSTECFRKLKVLELIYISEKSTSLACCFIQSLPNLEKLLVKDSSFCQIFQFEGLSDDQRNAALTHLTELRLSKLPELTHLWKEEFQPGVITFSNLKLLEVLDCGKLKTLVPSLVSFNNLTILKVSGCHGFTNLITYSIGRSLMQIRRMSITDCKMIEEIVACDADEIQGAIVFSQLRYLKLSCLPNLESFSLRNHGFEFPNLQKVIVHECPKLEIFCQGDLTTPKLQQVLLAEDEDEDDEEKRRWEGDLKTTIRKLFEEMNVHNSEVIEVTLELPTLQ